MSTTLHTVWPYVLTQSKCEVQEVVDEFDVKKLEEALPTSKLPRYPPYVSVYDDQIPKHNTEGIPWRFQDESMVQVTALYIPCRGKRAPNLVILGAKTAVAGAGAAITRVWLYPHIRGFCHATRVMATDIDGRKSSFIVVSSSSIRSPRNHFFDVEDGDGDGWHGDILIFQEVVAAPAFLCDIDGFGIRRLLQYMTVRGDWHRQPLSGGGLTATHFNVLYISGHC